MGAFPWCESFKFLNSRLQSVVGQCPGFQFLTTGLGLLLLLRCSLCLLSRFLKMLVFGRRKRLTAYGEWGVVTGATDGIGKALAFEMASKGMKIFLISRSPDRLQQVAEELRATFPGCTVKTLAVDFSQGTTEELYKTIETALKNIDVGVLINNVGLSYPHAMYYNELDLKTLDDLITVNVRSVLVTSRVVYPGMCERKRGAIICVGSGASEIASDPLYCAYSATKASAEAFCRSLQPECASKNILVQCHVPLLVTTKLSKVRTASLMTPSTKTYANYAISAIEHGSVRGPTTISPYWVHRCIIWLSNAVPTRVWETIYLPRCLSIRKRALKKKQEQAGGSKKEL